MLKTTAGRVALAVLGALLAVTLLGIAVMWPGDEGTLGARPDSPVVGDTTKARVLSVSLEGCEDFAGPGCRLVGIELLEGANRGRRSSVTFPADEFAPTPQVGDRIRVVRNATGGIDPALADQLPIGEASQQPFAFVDFERSRALLVFALAFAVLVVVLARWQGLRSLAGLVVSLFVVVEFLVPAILAGSPPLLVAVVGSLAVMFITVVLAHGIGPKSAAAMLGTAATLLLTALLAALTIKTAHITGFASEESVLLLGATRADISLTGLVLAGIVVAALGVLDDVTVSQASTVLALRRADPEQPFRTLFRRGLAVGRDHLSATVNTLVFAYVGAALPILLIFSYQGTGFGEAINRENTAVEIVGMLVGSIGIIAAVPLTTALAALLASAVPAQDLPEEDPHAGHHH